MAQAPLFPERIREDRVRTGKPRTVDHSPNFRDLSGLVVKDSQEERDVLEVIRLLGCGGILPERFYRNGIDRDVDDLLQDNGIKHLHLGCATSDVLLFLVEYEETVLLLEIADHAHFATRPVGATLRKVHDNAMLRHDKLAENQRAGRIANNAAVAKKGLLPRTR